MYLRNVEELIIYSLQNQSQYVEIKISFLIIILSTKVTR